MPIIKYQCDDYERMFSCKKKPCVLVRDKVACIDCYNKQFDDFIYTEGGQKKE